MGSAAPLPEGDSLMPHVKYILENRSNELCVGDVFEKLLNIAETSAEPPIYDTAKKKIIMKALNVHLAVERVVVNGLKLIASQLNTTGYFSVDVVGATQSVVYVLVAVPAPQTYTV